jgi:predicted protein tyrosine phosphatase
MNILFICTANRDRSRTAELYFQNKYPDHRFRSAGINRYLSERHGGVHVKRYMLDVADRIVCAEFVHSDYIMRQIDKKYSPKIEIMHLEDTEPYMSEQLIGVLEEKFNI